MDTKNAILFPNDSPQHAVKKKESQGLSYKANPDESMCSITELGNCKDFDLVIPSEIDGLKVTSIDKMAFYGCKSLRSVVIPDSVTSIGDSAFERCVSLTDIEIPDSVTSIGNRAFYRCKSLSGPEITDSVVNIGKDAFYECKSQPYKKTQKPQELVKDNNPQPMVKNNESKNLDYSVNPDGKTCIITGIGHCRAKNIYIPSEIDGRKVTGIGYRAFSLCKTLTSVVIPDSVTSIDEGAFSWCTSMLSIEIPRTTTTIGNAAFSNCKSLTSIFIPKTVKNMGKKVFNYCDNLRFIQCEAIFKPLSWPLCWVAEWSTPCNAKVVWGYKR